MQCAEQGWHFRFFLFCSFPIFNCFPPSRLAYGCYIALDPEKGLIVASVSESSSGEDLAKALEAVIQVAEAAADDIDEEALEAARSVTIGSQLEQLDTHQAVAESRFKGAFRHYSTVWMLEQVEKVTVKDMRKAAKKYLSTMRQRYLCVATIPLEDNFRLEKK